MAVNVDEMGAVSVGDENRRLARPFFHPVHGHAAEERIFCALVKSDRFRVISGEFLLFPRHEFFEALPADRFVRSWTTQTNIPLQFKRCGLARPKAFSF
jgi:hypothetical protein